MAKEMNLKSARSSFVKLVSTGIVDFDLTLILTEKEAEILNINPQLINKISDCSAFLNNNLSVTSPLEGNNCSFNILDKIRLSSNNATINTLIVTNKAFKKKVFIEYVTMSEIYFAQENRFMKDVLKYVTEQNFLFIVENNFLNKLVAKIKFEIKINNKSVKSFENICCDSCQTKNVLEEPLTKENFFTENKVSYKEHKDIDKNFNKSNIANNNQKLSLKEINSNKDLEGNSKQINNNKNNNSFNKLRDLRNQGKFNQITETKRESNKSTFSIQINPISHIDPQENSKLEKNEITKNKTEENADLAVHKSLSNSEENCYNVNQSKSNSKNNNDNDLAQDQIFIPANLLQEKYNKANSASSKNKNNKDFPEISSEKANLDIKDFSADKEKEENNLKQNANINAKNTSSLKPNAYDMTQGAFIESNMNYNYFNQTKNLNNLDNVNNINDVNYVNDNLLIQETFERFRYDFSDCNYLYVDINEILALNKTYFPLKEFRELIFKISNEYLTMKKIFHFPSILTHLASLDLDSIAILNDLIVIPDIYIFDRKEATPLLSLLTQINTNAEIPNINKPGEHTTLNNLEFWFINKIKKKNNLFPKIGIFLDQLKRATIIQQEGSNNLVAFHSDYDFNLIPASLANVAFEDYESIFSIHLEYLKSVFIGGLLSRLLHGKSFNTCFTAGNESLRRVIELIRFKIDPPLDFNYYLISIKKTRKAQSKQDQANKRKEQQFVLDSTNVIRSKMKVYNPLYDTHLISFFSSKFTKSHLRKTGFISRNGTILEDPDQKKITILESKNLIKIYEQEKNNLERIKEEKEKMKSQIKSLLTANMHSIRPGSIKEGDNLQKLYKCDSSSQKKWQLIEDLRKKSPPKTAAKFSNNTYIKLLSSGQRPKSLFRNLNSEKNGSVNIISLDNNNNNNKKKEKSKEKNWRNDFSKNNKYINNNNHSSRGLSSNSVNNYQNKNSISNITNFKIRDLSANYFNNKNNNNNHISNPTKVKNVSRNNENSKQLSTNCERNKINESNKIISEKQEKQASQASIRDLINIKNNENTSAIKHENNISAKGKDNELEQEERKIEKKPNEISDLTNSQKFNKEAKEVDTENNKYVNDDIYNNIDRVLNKANNHLHLECKNTANYYQQAINNDSKILNENHTSENFAKDNIKNKDIDTCSKANKILSDCESQNRYANSNISNSPQEKILISHLSGFNIKDIEQNKNKEKNKLNEYYKPNKTHISSKCSDDDIQKISNANESKNNLSKISKSSGTKIKIKHSIITNNAEDPNLVIYSNKLNGMTENNHSNEAFAIPKRPRKFEKENQVKQGEIILNRSISKENLSINTHDNKAAAQINNEMIVVESNKKEHKEKINLNNKSLDDEGHPNRIN